MALLSSWGGLGKGGGVPHRSNRTHDDPNRGNLQPQSRRSPSFSCCLCDLLPPVRRRKQDGRGCSRAGAEPQTEHHCAFQSCSHSSCSAAIFSVGAECRAPQAPSRQHTHTPHHLHASGRRSQSNQYLTGGIPALEPPGHPPPIY